MYPRGEREDFLQRHFKAAILAKIPIRPRVSENENEGRRAKSPLSLSSLLHFFRLSRSFADLDSKAAAIRKKEGERERH